MTLKVSKALTDNRLIGALDTFRVYSGERGAPMTADDPITGRLLVEFSPMNGPRRAKTVHTFSHPLHSSQPCVAMSPTSWAMKSMFRRNYFTERFEL